MPFLFGEEQMKVKNDNDDLKIDGFNSVVKIPKDMGFHEEPELYGLHINAGYETKRGEIASVERRSMAQMLRMFQYVHGIPGYRWCVAHMRLTVVSKDEQQGREELAKSGPVFLTKLMKEVQRSIPRANLYYRWHLEWSETAGYHFHVAIFFNSNQIQNTDAFMASFHKVKNSNSEYSFATAQFICPDIARIKQEEVKAYFLSNGLNLDSSKEYICLESEIEREFAFYWLSYMCKKHTKEKIIEEGKRISGGSLLPGGERQCKRKRIIKSRRTELA